MPADATLELSILPVGEWQANACLLVDPATREAALIDPGAEAGRLLEWARDVSIRSILLTHAHPDHLGAVNEARRALGAPVLLHPADWELAASFGVTPDGPLNGGDALAVGGQTLRAVHTPGHTPGSVCLRFDERAIVGDAIFPGGPGRTNTPEELETSLASLREAVFTWPDHTVLYPGHGPATTVGRERPGFEAFLARPRPAGLYGDVTW